MVSFRTFRRPQSPKPVSCPEIFFIVSYSNNSNCNWIKIIENGYHFKLTFTLLFLGYLRESTNSLLWTELVYSASDLLKFINDRAYDQAFRTANAIQKEKIGEVICFLFRNSDRIFSIILLTSAVQIRVSWRIPIKESIYLSNLNCCLSAAKSLYRL